MLTQEARVLLEGLVFPECPRWHEGALWFSDMHAHQVMTVDPQGKTRVVIEVPGQPGGLGWTPDGKLLIVSMTDRRLLRLDSGVLNEVADLSLLASGNCNDMVVDRFGRAYIGHFGFDFFARKPARPAELIMVTPDGNVQVVADSLDFPNGVVITPDGGTLIVAETFGSRLTAFDISTDGLLSGRRVWAELDKGIYPDGICLDAEGAVWLTKAVNTGGNEVIRVKEGGELTNRIKVSNFAFACMLGGPERRTLYIATAATPNPEESLARHSGRIETVQVEVPGAGLP